MGYCGIGGAGVQLSDRGVPGGRWRCGRVEGGVLLGSALVVVDVATVPEGDDDDQENVVGDAVDDPIVADSHPIAGSAS
jgi:hypothetical protein